MGSVPRCFGIKNCDSMKKAFAWLAEHGIDYEFIDYKKAGIVEANIQDWVSRVGWEKLLNTKGLTWRKLPEEDRINLDEAKAMRLMMAHPSMIKRPVLDTGTTLLVGFDLGVYEESFK